MIDEAQHESQRASGPARITVCVEHTAVAQLEPIPVSVHALPGRRVRSLADRERHELGEHVDGQQYSGRRAQAGKSRP
jgi:hypothetical protein